MKITWAGQACFQISVSNSKNHSADIVIDPFSDIGLKMPNFEADVLLVTHDHKDHNKTKAVKPSGTDKKPPFIIEGPGEYEVKGVFIQGIASFHDDVEGKERGSNTIYIIEAEDMRICHLGDLGQKQLTNEQLEKMGTVDILMIPVGGVYTIDGSEATKIIGQLEPKMVIPMHYALEKLTIKLEDESKFLKAMGKKDIVAVDKLTIKSSALPEGELQVVLLKP